MRQERRISWASHIAGENGDSSGSSNQRSSTSSKPKEPPIPEEDPVAAGGLQPVAHDEIKEALGLSMVSPSGLHVVASSPVPLSNPETPAALGGGDYLTSHAAGESLTLPLSPSPDKLALEDAARKGGSLDPKLLAGMGKLDLKVTSSASSRGVADQLAAGSSSAPGVVDEDGIVRKDTALEPEERNARLEVLEQEQEKVREASGLSKERTLKDAMVEGWGRPFKVEWARV